MVHPYDRIQRSWMQIIRQQTSFGMRFYDNLFRIAPEVRPMFRGDMKIQANMLEQQLDLIIMSLDKPTTWVNIARQSAIRHAGYGVKPFHYRLVGQALIAALEESLQDEFTPDLRTAWGDAYDVLSRTMIEAAY